MAEAAAVQTPAPLVESLAIEDVRESPMNPRKTFTDMAELAADVARRGVLQPILVRPIKVAGSSARFEVVFGARRFRAAEMAGLETVPAMVRQLDDAEALELMVIENAQRNDVHPLEEAHAFRELHTKHKQSAQYIAERTGRSLSAIYDSLRLANLVPAAKKHFLAGDFTLSHAIILSRLDAETQERAIDPDEDALFMYEDPELFDPREEATDDDGFKPRSVREFQAWVDRRVKFDATAPDVPQLFPETAQVVAAAKEEAEKVVHVTYERQLHPDARQEGGQRVYAEGSWERADGRSKSRTCEHSVTGVIVIGPGRGEALRVCIAREKCQTHWADWQKEKAQAAKRAASGGGSSDNYIANQRAQYEAAEKKREAEKSRWRKALPAITSAVQKRVKELPAKTSGLLGDLLVDAALPYGTKLPTRDRGKTLEDLVRAVVFVALNKEARDDWNGYREFPTTAKKLGIDVAKILDEVAPLEPKPKAEAPAKAAPKSSKPAAKKASKKKAKKK